MIKLATIGHTAMSPRPATREAGKQSIQAAAHSLEQRGVLAQGRGAGEQEVPSVLGTRPPLQHRALRRVPLCQSALDAGCNRWGLHGLRQKSGVAGNWSH